MPHIAQHTIASNIMSDLESILTPHERSRQSSGYGPQDSRLRDQESSSRDSYTSDQYTREHNHEPLDTEGAHGASESEEKRQESESHRRARWREKETLYPDYPLYSVVPGQLRTGSSTQITVKGVELGRWLDCIESLLTGHQLAAQDGVGLQLAASMDSLAGLFPVTLAQALQPGTSSNHPVTRLFGDIALVFWVYARDPAREYHGVKQELDGMRRAVQNICSSEVAVVLSLLAKSSCPNAGVIENTSLVEEDNAPSATGGDTSTPETHSKPGEEFQAARNLPSQASGSLVTQKSVHPLLDLSRMSPENDDRKEVASCTTSVTLNTMTTEGPTETVWNQFADWDWSFNQRKWKAKAAGEPKLYEVWPGWVPGTRGKREIRIKGQIFQYWADCIDTRHEGQDPARLIAQLSALLDCARDSGPYYIDQLRERKTPTVRAMAERRSTFNKDVALAVWIAAMDSETDYWTMVAYLEWLKKRACGHVGLRLPPVLSARPTASILENYQSTSGAALTAGGDSTASPRSSHRSALTSGTQ
jgi:hypothetical protein